MIELLAATLLLPAAALASSLGWRLRRRRGRYRRCLASIDRLERELFPEWFPAPRLTGVRREDFEFRVEATNHVQLIDTPILAWTSCSSKDFARHKRERQLALWLRGLGASSLAAEQLTIPLESDEWGIKPGEEAGDEDG